MTVGPRDGRSWLGLRRIEEALEVERAEGHEQQEHGEEEAEVTDAVDDERLLAGGRAPVLLEVEADQQVGAEPDAFPADEQHQQVVSPVTRVSIANMKRLR